MHQAKRILIIGNFGQRTPESVQIERCHWAKGFIRLGHDVQMFDYKAVAPPFWFIRNRRINKWFVRRRVDSSVVELAKSYHPDIVIVSPMNWIDPEAFDQLRSDNKSAVFVGRDNDWFPEDWPLRIRIAQKMDCVIATNAGDWLQTYRRAGVPKCAFMPNSCDPDIQRAYSVDEGLRTDLIYIGRTYHRTHQSETDPDRHAIPKRLSQMPNARVYGCFGRGPIGGIDCFRVIAAAKIALSINAVNNVRLYHSDRLVNCVSCGAFTLAKRVPDSHLLFEDGVHLKYFDGSEEFFEMADWYLKHEEERWRIARAGMEHAHREFNGARIAGLMLDLIETGSYEAAWAHVI
jgi:glycosyltransferase involved in cell wall biosynthesis